VKRQKLNSVGTSEDVFFSRFCVKRPRVGGTDGAKQGRVQESSLLTHQILYWSQKFCIGHLYWSDQIWRVSQKSGFVVMFGPSYT
jgi:hypothetical protein